MMSQYLIAVAVGPVQEFIASARKLRDLWYGSYLLSELSKSVARSFAAEECELIFPAVVNGNDLEADSSMNVANKILVLSPAGSDPEILVSKARKAFLEHWKSLCSKALKEVPGKLIDEKMFWQQVDDFGEFFAAWYPYDVETYVDCRKKVEEKLSGRKSFRSFMAPTWKGAGKPKSSLDGIRESVLKTGGRKTHLSFMFKKGEHLDALGIVKRFGPWTSTNRPYFDNLAQVAIQPYLAGLHRTACDDSTIAEIITTLPCGANLYPWDEQLPPVNMAIWEGWPEALPPELLHPAVFEEEKNESASPETHQAWENLGKRVRHLWKKTAEPQPYAAFLMGDGDHMGEALNCINTVEHHQRFSQKLDEFAREVHGTVESCEGRVIYSGGDDVMAYVPLHKVLDCAKAVNDLFSGFMEDACRNTAITEKPTFSIGVVIIHQRKPLHSALALARKAEKHAKQEGGRNALAIIQDKRGGSELIIQGRWKREGNLSGLTDRLKNFVTAHEEGRLSSKLGYQLRELEKEYGVRGPTDESGELKFNNGLPDNVLAAETLRVIKHKSSRKQGEDDNPDLLSLTGGHTRLRPLSDEMVISRQLSQAKAHSQGVWKHGKGE
ncbi:MAG: type III-B CRISPR-associated protein Cas10/Cmr2 [Desulfamplus sp.]|nr:type III-B CRISPR-associated protein Cas10/Cmr2 [Desulfamplus sp.]